MINANLAILAQASQVACAVMVAEPIARDDREQFGKLWECFSIQNPASNPWAVLAIVARVAHTMHRNNLGA